MLRRCAPCCGNWHDRRCKDCRALDAQDPLRELRDLFTLPEGVIYLDGNSLGVLPQGDAPERVAQAITEEWGQGLIRSWNSAGWFELPQRLGDKIAALVGAQSGRGRGHRQHLDQPVQGAQRRLAHRGRRCTRAQGDRQRAQQLPDRPVHRAGRCARSAATRCAWWMTDADRGGPGPMTSAVLMLTHVNYRTGAMHDMAALTARGASQRRAGGLGPGAQRGRGAGRPACGRRRLRHRLRLQVPQWRPGRAGVRVGSSAPCRPLRAAAGRLVGPCGALRIHARLPAGAGDRALPVRHPADPEHGGARMRAGHPAGRRSRWAAWRHCAASRWR